MPIVPDEYVNSFKPELSEAVFKWCNGASFAELCKMCDVFEGTCSSGSTTCEHQTDIVALQDLSSGVSADLESFCVRWPQRPE